MKLLLRTVFKSREIKKMESLVDKVFRKIIRKTNPMWYLYYCWRKGYSDKRIDDFIRKSYTQNDGDFKKIKRIMKYYWVWKGVHHSDFYEMSLDQKSNSERKQFVPRWEEVDLYYQVNDRKYINLLVNKWNCYNFFKDFYKRQVVLVSEEDVRDKSIRKLVVDFIQVHDRFIIKPLSLHGGKGFRVIDMKSVSSSAESILLECMNMPQYSKGFLLEEPIVQDSRMASFHPQSVNTIRILTVNYGDTIETKWPVLCMGRGDSVVDNAAAGGVVAAIDEINGTIICASDEKRGSTYSIHPDTHKSLIGFQIPFWNELCDTIKSMASMCPDCHIMGWDMALTDNGWVVVECKFGPEILIQCAMKRGVRKEFEVVKKRLHAKKGESYKNRLLEQYLSVPLN